MMVTSESLRTLGNEYQTRVVGSQKGGVFCYGPVGKEDPPS